MNKWKKCIDLDGEQTADFCPHNMMNKRQTHKYIFLPL